MLQIIYTNINDIYTSRLEDQPYLKKFINSMDFSLMEAALTKAHEAPAPLPVAMPGQGLRVELDTQKVISELQKQKRENELSHRTKAKKQKQMERSKGYLERLESKEKQAKKDSKKKAIGKKGGRK